MLQRQLQELTRSVACVKTCWPPSAPDLLPAPKHPESVEESGTCSRHFILMSIHGKHSTLDLVVVSLAGSQFVAGAVNCELWTCGPVFDFIRNIA